MERMVRRWPSMTEEEVQRLFDTASPEEYAHGGLGEGVYAFPYAESLVGKSFRFLFPEGREVSYYLEALHTLVWEEGGEKHCEFYQGHEREPGVYFVQHTCHGSVPPRARTLVIDAENGLVTLCEAKFGNGVEAREIAHQFSFGRVDGSPDPGYRHHLTSRLVGKAIYWTYHESMPPIKHIYSSEYYYTYVMKMGDRCWMASNPADFVQIRDNLFIFSFLEERQAGTQGFFLINLDTLRDVGSFLGINSEGKFESYTVGAKGEETTMYTYLSE